MKKSVLFLVQNLPVPQDRRVFLEAKALKANGFSVAVISPRKKNQKKFEILSGVRVYRYLGFPAWGGYFSYFLEYAYSFFWTFYLSLKVYFTRGFSVIHAANPPDLFFLIAAFFKMLGVKFVWDQHDLAPDMFLAKFKKSKSNLFYKALLFLEKMSVKLCDVYITTCKSGEKVTVSRNVFKAPRFVVRSAPDLEKINSENVNPGLTRKAKSKFCFLAVYLGVMGPQDGIDKLLRSIRYIVKELGRKDIGFALLGDSDALESLKKMTRDLEIKANVLFTGWADSQTISSYLSISDVGLMPEPKNSYTDNSLHNKVLEYMSFSLPVVSYDLKEARESAGKAAVYVTGNDEEEFARSIVKLINNLSLREEMGKIGRERLRNKKFDWNYSARELLKAYRNI